MGVVTGKGLAELIREEYGIRWSVLATSAVLVANLGICVSDFVGAGAALGLAGIPPQASVPVLAVGIWLVIVRGSYRSAERIFIWFTIPFFAYPVAAILSHPHWGAVGKALVVPQLHLGSTYLLLLIATVGTTITPYMQLYLQSAVVERGVRDEDLRREETEAVSGAVFACVISAFIVIATGATLYTHGIHEIGTAADAARALTPFAGQFAEALFGIGLLGASLLAAAILPIATSYVVSESLGYEKGIGRRREEAPVFVAIITAMIALSAVVAVVPGVPVISLLVAVQVVNGVLLPINLFFIWRLSRSHQLMGERRSRGLLDGAAGVTVVVLSCLSIVLVIVTVAGL
jgi:Mn2+/Fe2+ NRAMP family transporter